MIHAFIKKGCFQGFVSLMIISRKLSESENVDDVSVMMGTPANKALLGLQVSARRFNNAMNDIAWQFMAKQRMQDRAGGYAATKRR